MPKRKKRKMPSVGSVFTREYKGKTHKLKVVNLPNSEIGYELGKQTLRSPSAAAKLITGTEVNGWVWWRME